MKESLSFWLQPHWLKLPLWFEHSLAGFVGWTGRCCLYPLGGSLVSPLLAGTCFLYLETVVLATIQTIGKHWGFLGFLSLASLRLSTKPGTIPQLHCLVLGLVPLTWFNCAHHRLPLVPLPQTSPLAPWSLQCKALHTLHWCNPNRSSNIWHMTWGGHSLPACIMLKRSPGSKIYCAPSSTIELLKGSLATCDSPAGHCCLYREMEQYGLPVRGVVLFAPSIALPLVADGI